MKFQNYLMQNLHSDETSGQKNRYCSITSLVTPGLQILPVKICTDDIHLKYS